MWEKGKVFLVVKSGDCTVCRAGEGEVGSLEMGFGVGEGEEGGESGGVVLGRD